MILFVGLGNFGSRYDYTRHNVGFWVLDRLKEKIQNSDLGGSYETFFRKKHMSSLLLCNSLSGGKKILLAWPETMMNNSGKAVEKLVSYQNIKTPDLWVIHDDLDINIGQHKVQFGIGPKDHNGILSIEKELKTKEFWRVRVGIENRGGYRDSGEEYVLGKFSPEEREIMEKTVDSVVDWIIGKHFTALK